MTKISTRFQMMLKTIAIDGRVVALCRVEVHAERHLG